MKDYIIVLVGNKLKFVKIVNYYKSGNDGILYLSNDDAMTTIDNGKSYLYNGNSCVWMFSTNVMLIALLIIVFALSIALI